jgi:hypothetical protein
MGGENQNSLFLLIQSLSLRYISRSSVFPQARSFMDVTERGAGEMERARGSKKARSLNQHVQCVTENIFPF